MSLNINIEVVNFEDELKSFPLEQEILLESSSLLEDSLLKNKITLLREIPEAGLLNTAELYNYNIGYVKESFTTVDLIIRTYEKDSKYYVECKPEKPLHPNSRYILFIDKDLTEEFISISKPVSKGPSNLEIVSLDNKVIEDSLNPGTTIILEVTSQPFITSSANIIKLNLKVDDVNTKTYTVDAKSSNNFISVLGIKIKVLDSAFGLGEKFSVDVKGGMEKLPDNYIVSLKTALTSDIKPVDNLEPSQKVSNEDILEFYSKTDTVIPTEGLNFKDPEWMLKEISIEYLGYKRFVLHLKTLNSEDLDLENLSYRAFPAYNKYDLEMLGLYSEDQKFNLNFEIIDDKTIVFTLEEIL